MKELRIFAQDGIWCAEHLEDRQPDKEIMGLFDGEHVLPTPYTTDDPASGCHECYAATEPGQPCVL